MTPPAASALRGWECGTRTRRRLWMPWHDGERRTNVGLRVLWAMLMHSLCIITESMAGYCSLLLLFLVVFLDMNMTEWQKWWQDADVEKGGFDYLKCLDAWIDHHACELGR